MREIKFEWFSEAEQRIFSWDEVKRLCSWEHLNSKGIRQFTGLFDKQGKEIYEGDILRTITYDTTYEVSFHIGSFVLIDKNPGFTTIMKQPIGCYQTDILLEVIGNIYENPELLK